MISLIHPSRGRPAKSFSNAKTWIEQAGVPVQLVVSIDADDPFTKDYCDLYQNYMLFRSQDKFLIGNNDCVVQAANRAAEAADGDILIYLSDDFKCFDNWGAAIEQEYIGTDTPMLIKVDDCLQRFGVDVLTIPIMNQKFYNLFGYFFHPEYKSMFCDQQLYHAANNINALKMCAHLKFPHEHYCNGKTQIDETYKRSNLNWNEGKTLYAKHKAEGFPRYQKP